MFYKSKDFIPVVHPSSFVHPQAAVTGNVIIGKDVYVGPGAALRGDWGRIIIEDGCNVQEKLHHSHVSGSNCIVEEKRAYRSWSNYSRGSDRRKLFGWHEQRNYG